MNVQFNTIQDKLKYALRDYTSIGRQSPFSFSFLTDEQVYQIHPERYAFYLQMLDALQDPNSGILDRVLSIENKSRYARDQLQRTSADVAKALRYLVLKKGIKGGDGEEDSVLISVPPRGTRPLDASPRRNVPAAAKSPTPSTASAPAAAPESALAITAEPSPAEPASDMNALVLSKFPKSENSTEFSTNINNKTLQDILIIILEVAKIYITPEIKSDIETFSENFLKLDVKKQVEAFQGWLNRFGLLEYYPGIMSILKNFLQGGRDINVLKRQVEDLFKSAIIPTSSSDPPTTSKTTTTATASTTASTSKSTDPMGSDARSELIRTLNLLIDASSAPVKLKDTPLVPSALPGSSASSAPPVTKGGSFYTDMLDRAENERKIVKDGAPEAAKVAEKTLDEIADEVDNHPIFSPENEKISMTDRVIFIAVTFMIRGLALFLIDWGVNSQLITTFNRAFLYYTLIYFTLFMMWALLVNAGNDTENIPLKMAFYYVNWRSNGIGRILAHVAVQTFLIPIPFIVREPLRGAPDTATYEKRRAVYRVLSNFTFFVWVMTSIIALRY